jgi:hypothetical protein
MIPPVLGSFLVSNCNGDTFTVALGMEAYAQPIVPRPDGGGGDFINVARWTQTITYEGGPRIITFSAAWNERTDALVATDALRQIARALGVYALGPTVGGTLVHPVTFPLYDELVTQIVVGPDRGLRASGRAACVRPLCASESVASFSEWVEPYFVTPPS